MEQPDPAAAVQGDAGMMELKWTLVLPHDRSWCGPDCRFRPAGSTAALPSWMMLIRRGDPGAAQRGGQVSTPQRTSSSRPTSQSACGEWSIDLVTHTRTGCRVRVRQKSIRLKRAAEELSIAAGPHPQQIRRWRTTWSVSQRGLWGYAL
ncbi:MAG: hypothetical protein ACLRWQ_15275 [Flavonifractor plautii]